MTNDPIEAQLTAPFKVVTGKDEKRVIWRLDELLSKTDLAGEGGRMMHCVVTYAQNCARNAIRNGNY